MPESISTPEDLPSPEGAADQVTPYSCLAPIYDHVMRHVDYNHWANHIHDLLRQFGGSPRQLVELACGTGNATFALADRGYVIRGYDGCEAMVQVAIEKARSDGQGLHFGVRDLCDLHDISPVEAVVCLYDSINYLLQLQQIDDMLQQVHGVLIAGGTFIFDVCTEQNSVLHFDGVEDTEQGPGFSYTRRSDYHRDTRLQVNAFDIHFNDGRQLRETHVQHIYSIEQLRDCIGASPLALVAILDGFSHRPGTEHSNRVHFILQRPLDGDQRSA